jgi:hypothetical protein
MPPMTWGRTYGMANVTGGDPGAGTSHTIPNGATNYFIYAVGSAGDRVHHRTAATTSLTGLAANSFIGPVGQLLGPFAVSPQSDKEVQVAEAGTGITAYYISFTRG